MKYIKYFVFAFAIFFATVGLVVYSGLYPMGADVPHSKLSYWALEVLRDKSIERSSQDIVVPDLSSPQLRLSGGADYKDMCSSCHLKPGEKNSDMSIGLYPKPPNLTLSGDLHKGNNSENIDEKDAQRQFWIIKHGIKASGMPAWGPTHDDERIWAIVAFLQKLPEIDGDQYQVLTTRGKQAKAHH